MSTANKGIAQRWFAAFNAHDLEALLALYADDAQHYSPKLKVRQPETNGLITGKAALRAWWRDAFDRLPSLRYEVERLTADDTPPPIAPADIIPVSIENGNTSAIAASGVVPSRPM